MYFYYFVVRATFRTLDCAFTKGSCVCRNNIKHFIAEQLSDSGAEYFPSAGYHAGDKLSTKTLVLYIVDTTVKSFARNVFYSLSTVAEKELNKIFMF